MVNQYLNYKVQLADGDICYRDKCYKPNEISLELIKQFFEGSLALYNLLNFCKDSKINTHAYCKGHSQGGNP